MKKRISDLSDAELKGKRVLVRADFNVPLEGTGITDDTRIRATLPTIRYLRERGARVILMSHLGRPGGVTPEFSLAPVARRLSELLGVQVALAPDCIGSETKRMGDALPEGGVLLLENVRFHPEEEKNDPAFARALAENGDLFVNDAFGTAHRAHASTAGLADYLPAVAGFLLAREIEVLGKALANPARPFVAIIGGSKVSSKIGVLRHLLDKVDGLVVGGAMAFTFLRAQGLATGRSLVEDDQMDVAREVMKAAQDEARTRGTRLLLPTDFAVAADPEAPEVQAVVAANAIPADAMGLDVGPETLAAVRQLLSDARTVLWNGPMGVFENPAFANGTLAVARMLADRTASGATTIVGGGDSVAAVEQAGLADRMSHVSTGGGASLEFLEGRALPGVEALQDQSPAPVRG